MMKLVFSSGGLQFVLTVSVFFTLSTSSTKECELQLTETTKSRSVVLRTIDMKLCQTECFQDSFILAYCRRSSDEFKRTEATEVYSVRPENQTSVLPKHCGSKVCSVTSQCVEGGCGTVYVESLPPCNLYTASKTGDLDVVKYILCLNSVDINIRGNRRKTPVMAAAVQGHKEIVELLVEHGADLSLREKSGSNILHNACYSGQFDVVKYILSQTSVDINSRGYIKKTPAMLAAAYGHKEVVELLVEHGADLSLREKSGSNILHNACYSGQFDVVKYILSQTSVDINSRGYIKKTPAMLAAVNGHKEVVELLVEHGADLSLREKSGSNILHNACNNGQFDVVKYILSLETVDINSRGYKKKTPVMLAGEWGHREVVELLVKRGADLPLRDTSRNNILHNACSRGQFDVVKYVLSLNSVDKNSRGYKKRTPVMVAAKHGYKEVVELLVNNEANLSLRDDDGKNFLNLARQGGHVEVVKLAMSL